MIDFKAETFKMVEEAPRYIETKLEKVCDWFGDDTRKACKSTIESDFAEIEEVIDLIVNNVTDPEMVCYEILCMCNSEMEKTGYFITDNELDSSSMVHVKDLDEKVHMASTFSLVFSQVYILLFSGWGFPWRSAFKFCVPVARGVVLLKLILNAGGLS